MRPTFTVPARALVRAVPDSYVDCLRERPVPIRLAAARAQHAAYVAALESAGVAVVTLPADEAHPDCCFVEDTAVILGAHAMITRPGAPSRRGECGPIAAALLGHCRMTTMSSPATLDGGDVLRVHDVLYVGLSSRTNTAGIAALAAFAEPHGLAVRTVPLTAGLHLKSVITLADPHTLVMQAGALAPATFAAPDLELLEVPEAAGANVLALGTTILVASTAPITAALLAARGHDIVRLDITEIIKGDGAFTCLSLRSPPLAGWCA